MAHFHKKDLRSAVKALTKFKTLEPFYEKTEKNLPELKKSTISYGSLWFVSFFDLPPQVLKNGN